MSLRRSDLGPGDVHRDGAAVPGSNEDPGTWVGARAKTMRVRKMISAAKRKGLAPEQFALPEQKKYPIDTAARVRNAAARLEQNKATLSGPDYRKARAAIARAAKRFGVESEYNKAKKGADLGPSGAQGVSPATATHAGFRVSVSSHPGGTRRVEVVHAGDVCADGLAFGVGFPVEMVTLFEKLKDAEVRLKALPDAPGDYATERKALAAEVTKLIDEAAAPRWNQIAKVGKFLGHPAGPFELTPAVFDEIIRNFKEVDGSRVPIDFEHASEAPESEGNIPVTGAPAQGWTTDLQNRGAEGLYGLTSFLEPALTYVREGRYRSFSPAIRFGAKHPETGRPIGARLTSVALVTRPFLRGLQPLAARDGDAAPTTGEPKMTTTKLDDKHPTEMMKSLKASMGLNNLATGADMKDHLDKLRDHAAEVLDKPHGHAMGHVSAGGVNCGEYTSPMADLVGAPATMTTSELLDAVEGLINSAMEIHEITEHNMNDQGDVLKLGERLGAAEGQVRTLTTLRDAALAESKALMADRDRLTLEVKARDAKLVELEMSLVTNAAELKTLRDAEVKREEATVGARVEEAFSTYKDSHKLSDAHRPMMTRELKSDPGNFEKLYPRVAPNQQHLLRDLAGQRTPTGSTTMGDRTPLTTPGPTAGPGAGPGVMVDQRLLTDKLVKERHMTREAATSYAYQIATGAAQMPAFTN